MGMIYIVIQAVNNDGVDVGYSIDSVWTCKRKAIKRCIKLNKQLEEEPEFGYGLYDVVQKCISTKIK